MYFTLLKLHFGGEHSLHMLWEMLKKLKGERYQQGFSVDSFLGADGERFPGCVLMVCLTCSVALRGLAQVQCSVWCGSMLCKT